MLKQVLLTVFVVGLGGVLIYFSQQCSDTFGRVSWFENNLGSTRNGYILIGFGFMIVGLLILFGVVPVSSPVQ